MTKECIIIGNGKSREGLDLHLLKSPDNRVITFGCNALYRDFWPDYLVAIDEKIIGEIKGSDYPPDRFIEPPEDEKWEPVNLHWGRAKSDDPDWNPQRPRSNAGMNAILEAIKKGYDHLYLLGLDFLLIEEEKALSNLYDGTHAYGPETRANLQDTRNRFDFFGYILEKNPKVQFILVFPQEDKIYEPELNNVHRCSLERLIEGDVFVNYTDRHNYFNDDAQGSGRHDSFYD